MIKKHNKKRKSKYPKELVSYGDFRLPPVVPGIEVKDLCERVDEFYKNYPKQHRKQKASDLINGAFYASRNECKSNPDWMSQAANSLRDVLYPLFSEQVSKNNLIKLFKKYATNQHYRSKIQNKEFIRIFNNLDKIYKQLTDLTHHGTGLKGFSEKQYINFSESDFDNILSDFISIFNKVLSLQQIYIHTIIDVIVLRKRKTKAIKRDLVFILNVNPDAHQYFYTKADERWLNWLWKNGFLDILKQKVKDLTQYGHRTPEINYLVKMAEKNPFKVVGIILKIKISKETFNPEVVDQFLRICSILSAEQLIRMVKKIRDERWIPLMGVFNQWGFEYEKMFKTLTEAKKYKELLILADAVLAVRAKEEIEKLPRRGLYDNPFYFDDLSYTKVFEHLAGIPDKYVEKALGLVAKVMREIVLLGSGKIKSSEVFPTEEMFHLFDVDFFELELGKRNHLTHREDVHEVVGFIKVLTEQLIVKYCNKTKDVRGIYKKYIGDFNDPNANLPDSRAMWRLRMFVLSLCPTAFKDELKNAFFRLFTVERYHEIISGTEYLKALRAGFSVLNNADKRDYVKRVIRYFVKKDQEKENEKENWHMKYGSRILSVIAGQLTGEEQKIAKDSGFIIQSDYEPKPTIGEITNGTIVPRRPITQEKFEKMSITEIVKKLRNEWAPKELSKQNTSDNFLSPLNAEEVSQLLRNDITKRFQKYSDNASLFFERGTLNAHYTYSFLRGIQEAIKNNKEVALQVKWGGVIDLLTAIKKSGEKEPFADKAGEHDPLDAWLADWNSVHSTAIDVIQELLSEQNDSAIINFPQYRKQLFNIISYLLSYPDPTPKDEQIDTAGMKTKAPDSSDYNISDPFTIAINSVRGRAFQAFVLFVYRDGKMKDGVKISKDTKKLYEDVLKKENTRALMFMFGYYLPTFYYRHKDWFKKLLPKIFPQNQERLYTASWEGYLANNLYEEIFFEPEIQKLYERGIVLKNDESSKQESFRQLDEGIAIHLALAYTYYEKFDFNHSLLKKFWKKGTQNHHAHFVSFIGRSLITSDNDRLIEAEKRGIETKERIRVLWSWMLKNYKDIKPFEEFGFWVNLEKNIFKFTWLVEMLKKTLEKTKGVLTWDYALTKSITRFASEAPKNTLEIARWYLLEGGVRGKVRQRSLLLDDEWFDALKILYGNTNTQTGTNALINDLIREGGSIFWDLKKIVEETEKL